MFIADALSHSYRLTTDDAQHDSREVCALREVYHTDGLSVSPKRLEESKLCTAQDPEMQEGHQAVPYHESWSELIEENGLVFHDERLVIPPSLHTNMLKKKTANISEWTDAYEEPESKRFRFAMQHLSIISARTV